jgi:hypothetical protein
LKEHDLLSLSGKIQYGDYMKNKTIILPLEMILIIWALLGALIGLVIGYSIGFFTGFGFFGIDIATLASQSTVSIIGLVIGLGSGVVLGKHYKDLINLVSLIVTVFFSAIICAFIGLFVGIGIVYFQGKGAFTSWQLISSPVKFTQIVDANTTTVWAQSMDDKLYSWSLHCPSQSECNKWIEIKAIPNGIHDFDSIKNGDTCDLGGGYVPKKQLGHVTECYLARMGMYESSWTVYYALLEDGTIWYWSYTSNGFAFIFIPLFSILLGIFTGVIVGVIIFIMKKKVK